MAFKIYPDASTAALLAAPVNQPVDSTKMTQAVPIASFGGNAFGTTIFIRISMSLPASLMTPPQVILTAGNPTFGTHGAPVTITATASPGQALGDGHSVDPSNHPLDAAAAWFDGPGPYADNVYLLKVFIEIDATTLSIQINSAGHDFVWVAADSDADSKQPWIQLSPATLPFGALINQTESTTVRSLQINNRGTGPLTVTNILPALAAPYHLNPLGLASSGLPVTVNPNPAALANIGIGFKAPPVTGTTAATNYTVNGDTGDGVTVPVLGSGHNNGFALSATTGQLEVVMLLDTSGSMAATDTTSGSTRLGELQSASTQFLNYLSQFGAGGGTVGVVQFPSTDPSNPSNLSLYNVVTRETIPATMTTELTKVNGLMPNDSTPMDFGIQDVLNNAYFSADTSNTRWLLLMSDGAWNVGSDPSGEVGTLAARNIRVYAAGYGQSGQVDYDTLKALSIDPGATPGGRALQVDIGAGTSFLALAKSFKSVVADGLTLQAAVDPDGVIQPGEVLRHEITITPYDSKAVFSLNWDTPNAGLTLQLLTPNCDLITPQTAATPGVSFHSDPRYQMFGIDGSYLRNDADPSHPRYGVWRIIVSYPQIFLATGVAAAAPTGQRYSYSVLTDSSLKLQVTLDRPSYFAGDSIGVTARVTAHGLPVTGASAQLSVTAPGQSMNNWLAGIPISAEEYQHAAAALAGKDAWSVYVKAFAAQLKGFVFDASPRQTTIAMTEGDRNGVYSATVDQTTIPDGHTLYVTVTGTTTDGVSFRRESSVDVLVGVRPDSRSTKFEIAYLPQTNPRLLTATVNFTPLDPLGNVFLTDPLRSQTILLQAQGAVLDPKLTTTFNGTYSTGMTYAPGSTPVLSLTIAGIPIVTKHVVPPVDQLIWVDKVLAFNPGMVAAAGANHHADPGAVLGDVRAKPIDRFVALGGYGVLTVAVDGQVIEAQGDDDITVFVHKTDDLRAYLVEALPAKEHAAWVAVGTSSGAGSSFSLKNAGISSARAIRIIDESGQTRDSSFNPLIDPGAGVSAVGVKKTCKDDTCDGDDDGVCIRLKVLNSKRQPLGGTVDVEFQPRETGEPMIIRGVSASADIDVKGLRRFPQVTIYQVTVTPTKVFKPVSQFVTDSGQRLRHRRVRNSGVRR